MYVVADNLNGPLCNFFWDFDSQTSLLMYPQGLEIIQKLTPEDFQVRCNMCRIIYPRRASQQIKEVGGKESVVSNLQQRKCDGPLVISDQREGAEAQGGLDHLLNRLDRSGQCI